MSTSCSTIQFGFDSTLNSFRTSSQKNKRNKYATPKMKILMTHYKDKYRFQREKLLMPLPSDLSTNFQTINFSSDNNNKNHEKINSTNLINSFQQTQNKIKVFKIKNKLKLRNFSIKKREKNFFNIPSRNYIDSRKCCIAIKRT